MTTENLTIDDFHIFGYKGYSYYQLPRHTKAGELSFEAPRISVDGPGAFTVWWTDWWWEDPYLARDFESLEEAIEFLQGL